MREKKNLFFFFFWDDLCNFNVNCQKRKQEVLICFFEDIVRFIHSIHFEGYLNLLLVEKWTHFHVRRILYIKTLIQFLALNFIVRSKAIHALYPLLAWMAEPSAQDKKHICFSNIEPLFLCRTPVWSSAISNTHIKSCWNLSMFKMHKYIALLGQPSGSTGWQNRHFFY